MANKTQENTGTFVSALLCVIYDSYIKEGLTDAKANKAAQTAVQNVIDHCSGTILYFSKGRSIQATIKHSKIVQEFNGRNQAELARKYNYSEAWVYKIIAESQKANSINDQIDLFEKGK